MRLALTELRRRPGRFVPVLGALSLLTVLLLLLGGLLDGLYLGSSGALRAQPGELVVYSADARRQLERSRVEPDVRAAVEAVDGVATVGGLGSLRASVAVDGADERTPVAVFGYEEAPTGFPEQAPGPGEAIADRELREAGIEEGDRVALSARGPELEVVGFADDVGYSLQPALWVDPATWRDARAALRPDTAVGEGAFEALVVRAEPGVDPVDLAGRIDDATGATQTLTLGDAVLAIPGLEQQNAVFSGLIGATLFVAGLVIALFAALLVVERTALYGVLKALGTPSRRLLAGLLSQSVAIAALAFVVGGLTALLLAQVVPETIPLRLEPGRALTTAALLVVTAAAGSAVTLRRVVRIDPAAAIGGA